MNCRNCNKPLEPGWEACPFCGENAQGRQRCPHCNYEIQSDWNVCPSCSNHLRPAGTPIMPLPLPPPPKLFGGILGKAKHRAGIAALKFKQYDVAIAAFTSVITGDPSDVSAYFYRALSYRTKSMRVAKSPDRFALDLAGAEDLAVAIQKAPLKVREMLPEPGDWDPYYFDPFEIDNILKLIDITQRINDNPKDPELYLERAKEGRFTRFFLWGIRDTNYCIQLGLITKEVYETRIAIHKSHCYPGNTDLPEDMLRQMRSEILKDANTIIDLADSNEDPSTRAQLLVSAHRFRSEIFEETLMDLDLAIQDMDTAIDIDKNQKIERNAVAKSQAIAAIALLQDGSSEFTDNAWTTIVDPFSHLANNPDKGQERLEALTTLAEDDPWEDEDDSILAEFRDMSTTLMELNTQLGTMWAHGKDLIEEQLEAHKEIFATLKQFQPERIEDFLTNIAFDENGELRNLLVEDASPWLLQRRAQLVIERSRLRLIQKPVAPELALSDANTALKSFQKMDQDFTDTEEVLKALLYKALAHIAIGSTQDFREAKIALGNMGDEKYYEPFRRLEFPQILRLLTETIESFPFSTPDAFPFLFAIRARHYAAYAVFEKSIEDWSRLIQLEPDAAYGYRRRAETANLGAKYNLDNRISETEAGKYLELAKADLVKAQSLEEQGGEISVLETRQEN